MCGIGVLAFWLVSCGGGGLDPRDITAAETLWKTNGLASYHLELEVMNGLTRRIEVTVENGSYQNGMLMERGADDEGWEPGIPLDEIQGRPYTVPGLFQTLREELSTGQRSVSVTFNPNRGYVEAMALGGIAGSAPTLVRVLSLEPLSVPR